MNWSHIEAEVKRLQVRIAKATREGRWDKVQALQRLLTSSHSCKMLAVKRVTESRGKRTPGVDGKIFKAQHVFGDPLNEPMILLKDVVEIINLQDFNHRARAGPRDCQYRVYSLSTSQVGSAFINDNLLRNAIACDGFHITKLKLIKRKMYRRGKRDLLEAGIVGAP